MKTDHQHPVPITLRRKYRLAIVKWCVVVLYMLSSTANGQERIVLTDAIDHIWIGKNISFLKDDKEPLTFNQVIKEETGKKFIRSTQDAPNFGNEQLSVWNRFTVVNKSSKEWMLLQLNPVVDTLKFYYKDSSNNYREIVTGESRPFNTRQYKANIYIFDLPVNSNDTAVFYLKVQTFKAEYPLIVITKESLFQNIFVNSIIKGVYIGLVVLIIIYNATLYIAIKDRNYLFYVFYVILTAFLLTEQSGLNPMFRGNTFHFLWNMGPALTASGGIFFCIFSSSFLEVRARTPRTGAAISYIFIPMFSIIILINLFNLQLLGSVLVQLTGIVVLITMMITGVRIYLKGFLPARFFIMASGSYFLGVLIYVGKTTALLPYNYFTTNSMEIGSAIEMIMFSVSMADRINIFRKEKARAQKDLVVSLEDNQRLITEQNRMLELKVDERTHQLRQILTELEHSQKELQQKNVVISKEKEKSDELLLNILPFETARELKDKGSAAAKMFDDVTVMFTDFKDFTEISEAMTPSELVEELDHCFKGFDIIINECEIEKIKTIGDSYMAAGGLPVPDKRSPFLVVKAALGIQLFMQHHNMQRIAKNKKVLEVRIGIHTGPVVAGIVGTKKFAYDIWGDTVNIASRMESAGVEGKINISSATYNLVKDDFTCSYRGKVHAKGKGIIDMYFVDAV
ncbi:MAG: adenylate/guanylate cyclase domain-containing protein [Chitinophagaceae bacterium]